MAFSLAGFGAGFAGKLSERLDEDRVRAEKLIDENRQIATRQRLAKQAQRDQEKKIAEELTSKLSLYFTPEQASEIMGKGIGAAQETLRMSGDLVSKGFSPAPLLNFSSSQNMSEAETSELITDIAAAPSVGTATAAAETGDLEATSTSATPTKSGILNLDYYTSSMKPADKEQATLDAAYAIAIQKSINGKTPDIRDKQAKLASELLTQIKAKDAALKTDDDSAVSSPFSKSTIESILKTQMKLALEANDFSVDLEGRLSQKIGDRVPEYNVAVIVANKNVRTLNTGEDNTPMVPQLNLVTKSNVQNAVKKIQLHARNQHTIEPTSQLTDRRVNPNEPFERFATNESGKQVDVLQQRASQGAYKIGDIVYVTEVQDGIPVTKIHVYTGVYTSDKHKNFIDAGKI
jgi:hypothetical protein